MAEDDPSHVCGFNTGIQNNGLFAILGQDGDGDSVHESIIAVHSHAKNFLRQPAMTFVIGQIRERTRRYPAG